MRRGRGPGLRVVRPESSVAIPEAGVAIPATRVAIPDGRDGIPATRVAIPEAEVASPAPWVEIPDGRERVPATWVAIPEAEVAIPGTWVAIPEGRDRIPDAWVSVASHGFRGLAIYPTYLSGKKPPATALGGEGHEVGHAAPRSRVPRSPSDKEIVMTTTKKTQIEANLTACENGLTANYPATQSWVFSGKTYQRADILNVLQGCIQAAQTTKTTNDAWRASVEAENGLLTALHPVLGALKKALEAQWGATSTKMTEFGFAPARTPVKTAASKAASAAKARATRAAKKAALATVGKAAAVQPATPTAASPGTAPVPPKTA